VTEVSNKRQETVCSLRRH